MTTLNANAETERTRQNDYAPDKNEKVRIRQSDYTPDKSRKWA